MSVVVVGFFGGWVVCGIDIAVLLVLLFVAARDIEAVKKVATSKAEARASRPVAPLSVVAHRVSGITWGFVWEDGILPSFFVLYRIDRFGGGAR
jgi:hypothetical protein